VKTGVEFAAVVQDQFKGVCISWRTGLGELHLPHVSWLLSSRSKLWFYPQAKALGLVDQVVESRAADVLLAAAEKVCCMDFIWPCTSARRYLQLTYPGCVLFAADYGEPRMRHTRACIHASLAWRQLTPTCAYVAPVLMQVMAALVRLPGGAVAATKMSLREDFISSWEVYLETEAEGGWRFLSRPDTHSRLATVMARLSGGSNNNSGAGGTISKL
jgi:enoyl-CoA hydratase/carnithine racemase